MTSIYLILLSRIPQLFSYDLKLIILSNHAKHPKKLVPYYVLPLFTILKSPYSISQLARLEKMTLVWRWGYSIKSQVFKALTNSPSNRSDNRDYEDLLRSNKPKLPEIPTGSP